MTAARVVAAFALAVSLPTALGCEPYEQAESPPNVTYVQNVRYTTNVYVGGGAVVSTPTPPAPSTPPGPAVVVAPATPAPVAVDPARTPRASLTPTGLAACDAYLARSERCVAAVAGDGEARARAEAALDEARTMYRDVAATGDPAIEEAMADRCAAAYHAYDTAPCAE